MYNIFMRTTSTVTIVYLFIIPLVTWFSPVQDCVPDFVNLFTSVILLCLVAESLRLPQSPPNGQQRHRGGDCLS